MAACLVGGAKIAIITAELFSVGWTVTATGTEWRRDYAAAPGAIVSGELRARVPNAAADAEPPLPNATREGDWFVWRLPKRPYPVVSFGSEPGATQWRICQGGSCEALSALTGAPEGGDITAVPCRPEDVPPQK